MQKQRKKEMSKKSVAKNYTYNLIYQILVMIIPLITTPYVSRTLGAEAIGIYSYTLSIATYFVLFGSLGIALYAQREIAYVQDDKEKRSKVFWEIVILRLITMSISMLFFYITFVQGQQYQLYYKVLLLQLLSVMLDISWFFQGMEEFKKTVIRNGIVKWITVIAILVFIKTPEDLTKYILIYVLGNVLGNASLWLYLPKMIKKIKLKELTLRRHIKPVFQLFIPQIAIQVYTVLDKTMIGKIVADKAELGYYEQSYKIINFLITITTSLGAVMVPRMANTFAKGDKEALKRIFKEIF